MTIKLKGVLIIVRRNFNISILDRNGDNAGRIACTSLVKRENSVISASVIYSFLLKQSYKPLSITTIWSKDISGDLQTLFSDQIWETITLSYKNPQIIKSSDEPLEIATWTLSVPFGALLCACVTFPRLQFVSTEGTVGGMLCTFSFLVSACSWHVIPIGGGCGFGSRSSLLGWLFWIGSVSATEKLAFGCSHCCGEGVGQSLGFSPFGDRTFMGLVFARHCLWLVFMKRRQELWGPGLLLLTLLNRLFLLFDVWFILYSCVFVVFLVIVCCTLFFSTLQCIISIKIIVHQKKKKKLFDDLNLLSVTIMQNKK